MPDSRQVASNSFLNIYLSVCVCGSISIFVDRLLEWYKLVKVSLSVDL